VTAELVGLAWLFWPVVDGLVGDGLVVDGLVCWLGCWSGVDPLLPPVCANAMPETSISANTNLLFMSLLLQKSKSARRARAEFYCSPTSTNAR